MSALIRWELLLALVLAVVVAACGKGDSSTTAQPTTTSTQAATTATGSAPTTSTEAPTTTTPVPATTTTVVISSATDVLVETVVKENGSGGTFSATNAAGMCPEGGFDNVDLEITETIWWFEDQYTCADWSGSWVVRGEIPLDPNFQGRPPTLEGTWWVLQGTDLYA